MAEKGRRIIGTLFGEPLYEPEPITTREQAEEVLLMMLDQVEVFPNGKRYWSLRNGKYFEDCKEGGPDLSHIVTVSERGDITSSKPYDVMFSTQDEMGSDE